MSEHFNQSRSVLSGHLLKCMENGQCPPVILHSGCVCVSSVWYCVHRRHINCAPQNYWVSLQGSLLVKNISEFPFSLSLSVLSNPHYSVYIYVLSNLCYMYVQVCPQSPAWYLCQVGTFWRVTIRWADCCPLMCPCLYTSWQSSLCCAHDDIIS